MNNVPIIRGNAIISGNNTFRPPHRHNHNGVDFVPRPRGNPDILSYADGVVILVRRMDGAAGNWVEIWHADISIATTYMHLQTIHSSMAVGARVTKGQVIGTLGNTGAERTSGGHLHFEMRRVRARSTNGVRNAVDPLPILRNATQSTAPAAPTATTVASFTHIVQRGETLSRIAQRYNTTVVALQTLNGIANANFIRTGQKLQLPNIATPRHKS